MVYAIMYGFFKSFFDKNKYYKQRLEQMMKNEKIVKVMKENYPLDSKKLKWKLEWYEAGIWKIVKQMISKGINPEIIKELRFDKEVQLTMKMLETETAMFYLQFV